MDEATDGLDKMSEQKEQTLKTIIQIQLNLISHKMTALDFADQMQHLRLRCDYRISGMDYSGKAHKLKF